jgi:hypothetical protein
MVSATYRVLLQVWGTGATFTRAQAVGAIMAHMGCTRAQALSRYKNVWRAYLMRALWRQYYGGKWHTTPPS